MTKFTFAEYFSETAGKHLIEIWSANLGYKSLTKKWI